MTYKLDRVIQNHSWRQDAAATGATKPAPSWEQTKEDCVGPDLPADDPYIPTRAEIAAEPPLEDTLYDRITDEIDRRKDIEAQLAKMTDAHAVVSQRLVGAQKEAAERDATIDELRGALESIAAHVGLVGSDQWAVDEIVVKVGEVAARADRLAAQNEAAHEVIDDARCAPRMSALGLSLTLFDRASAVMQQRRRDDEFRSQLAVAVGLDDSASLALILDTVTRDRPGREISRLAGLLDVLAAPVAFGERRLSTVERVEWALRRWLAEGKECDARMAQLIEAEVYLDVRGVPAYAAVPSDDPGDASEALTVAERLRLYFAAR